MLTEPQGRAADPARALIVDAWQRLTPALRRAAELQPDADGAVRLLTFISAGDALQALDDLGPAMGFEITSDGLRRLARMLVPEEGGDPLVRDDGVDAELRRILGFGDPLPPPQATNDTTWVDHWLNWLVPGALAAAGLDPAAVQLNNWVPKTGEMRTYLPMVLNGSATRWRSSSRAASWMGSIATCSAPCCSPPAGRRAAGGSSW